MTNLGKILRLGSDSKKKVKAQMNDVHYPKFNGQKSYERFREFLTTPFDWFFEELPDRFYDWVKR